MHTKDANALAAGRAFLRGLLRKMPAPSSLKPGYTALLNARTYPLAGQAVSGTTAGGNLLRSAGKKLVTGNLIPANSQGLPVHQLSHAAELAHSKALLDAGPKSSLLTKLRSLLVPGATRQTDFVHQLGKGVTDPRSFFERWANIPQIQARALGGQGLTGGSSLAERAGNTLRSGWNMLTSPAYTPAMLKKNPYLEAIWRNAPKATGAAMFTAPLLTGNHESQDAVETGAGIAGSLLGNPAAALNLAGQHLGFNTPADYLRNHVFRNGRSAVRQVLGQADEE